VAGPAVDLGSGPSGATGFICMPCPITTALHGSEGLNERGETRREQEHGRFYSGGLFSVAAPLRAIFTSVLNG
jgi:hypothetical protein